MTKKVCLPDSFLWCKVASVWLVVVNFVASWQYILYRQSMCGRYNIIPDAEAWILAFSLSEDFGKEISNLAPNYNVAPTQKVPMVRNNRETEDRELIFVHWGLARISHQNDKPSIDLCSHKEFYSLGNTARIPLSSENSL